MRQADYIIHGNHVLTMNDDMEIIDDGAIAIKDDKIIALGLKQNILQNYSATKIIDKTNHVILPGLINTHTHSPMVYLRGIADDLPLHEWLEKHIWPTEKKWLSPSFVYEATKLACLEMIMGGTTAFAELYFFCNDLAKATKEMGMRSTIASPILDFPCAAAQTSDECFNIAEDFIKNWQGDALITPAIGPHAPYSCGPTTLKRTQTLAEKYSLLIFTHLAETKWEVNEILTKYGTTPTRHLDAIGFLDSRILAAHCVWLDDEEIAILAKKNIYVSHCIDSNLKIASGFAPIAKMLQTNVNVSFGTDGAASNNDLDLLQEVATAAKIHKALANDPTVLDAKTALRMATRGGARAVNMSQQIGCLAPGFFADIIAINLEQPHMLPCYDIYSQIVYATKSNDVSTVMINGKLLMDDRKLLFCDKEAILTQAKEWNKKIKL